MTCEIWRTHPALADALLRLSRQDHTTERERADLVTYGLVLPDGRPTAVGLRILAEAPDKAPERLSTPAATRLPPTPDSLPGGSS